MSFAPRDSHETQVQFSLEQGVPAVIGVMGTQQLPYPSRAFDMSQCSRYLIPWTTNGTGDFYMIKAFVKVKILSYRRAFNLLI